MQPKLLKLGTALSVAAACFTATTAPAAAGGYDYHAALINEYIQDNHWIPTGTGWNEAYHTAKQAGDAAFVSTRGQATVSYYNTEGGQIYHGAPAFAKVTTVVNPTLVTAGPGQVVYAGDPVLVLGKQAVEIAGPVYFEFGSSALSDPAKKELDRIGHVVSAWYFTNSETVILLSGFTDATGSAAANEALARARNAAVRDYLIAEFGFDASRFVMRALGEEYANASATPYAGNQRRVTVSLVGLPQTAQIDGNGLAVPVVLSHAASGMAAEKGGEMVAVDETGAPVVTAENTLAATGKRCVVPTGPFSTTHVEGKVLATVFTDFDDYGGGKLVEVCGLDY